MERTDGTHALPVTQQHNASLLMCRQAELTGQLPLQLQHLLLEVQGAVMCHLLQPFTSGQHLGLQPLVVLLQPLGLLLVGQHIALVAQHLHTHALMSLAWKAVL